MTTGRESLVAIPQRPSGRQIGREWAAKAGDFLPLVDAGCVLFAGTLALLLHGGGAAMEPDARSAVHRLVWIGSAIAPFLLYQRRFGPLAANGEENGIASTFVIHFLLYVALVVVLAYGGRSLSAAPAAFLGLWAVIAFLLTATIRLLLARYLHRLARSGALAESVAVIGAGSVADRLIPLLRGKSVLFGVFDDRGERGDGFTHEAHANLDGLFARARRTAPDRILIALPGAAGRRLLSIVDRLRPLGVPLELCPPNTSVTLPPHRTGFVGDGIPVRLLVDRPIRRWNAVLKSAEDLVLGSVFALLLLPVLAAIALAVRLESPGPIVFRQRRHGINNREFDIYKFRTMRWDPGNGSAVLKQTQRGDARITPVGRFLRKWSLDELPQLFNVLEGHMSLVGPRPHAVNMRTEEQLGHEITDVYPHRHRVKPGITGWSQINGSRGAASTTEALRRRIELDLHYVENWSLMLDLRILCGTVREVLRATNAF